MSTVFTVSDSHDLLSESQAAPLIEAQRTLHPWRFKALQIKRLRHLIRRGEYETPERLDAATEKLMQDLLNFMDDEHSAE